MDKPPTQPQFQHTPVVLSQATYWCLCTAILAAFIACCADVSLLYVAQGGYEAQDYSFFRHINTERLYTGHYLGILFIPLELLGFIAVYTAMYGVSARWRWAIAGLAVYMTVLGVAYHALLGQFALWTRFATSLQASTDIVAPQRQLLLAFFEPLGAILPILFVILSLAIAYCVYAYPTVYPRRFAWANPLSIYLLCVVAYLLSPPIGGIFLVAGFNLSILVWLLLTTWALRRRI